MSDGIKNTTTAFDKVLRRQRLPRFIGSDGILRPYDAREALGLSWLKGLENGRFFSETYRAHLEIKMDDLACVVTDQRVLMIHAKSLRPEWDCPLSGT